MNRANNGVTVTYTYASSSASVATVSAAGVVTAVAPGVATITVTATGSGAGAAAATLTSAATVTVTALPAGLSAISVSPSAVSLGTGKTAQLAASATQPAGAPAATFVYGTTAPAVATVSASGLITAVAPGTAVITVTGNSAANASFAAASSSATINVTVAALPSGLSAISASPAAVALGTGKTAQIAASATQPTGAPAATFVYGSTMPSVATVSDAGLITAVAPGTAVITVTGNSAASADFSAASASTTVNVTVTALPAGLTAVSASPSSASILIGKSAQIVPAASQPSGAPAATFRYTSSAPSVATVSDNGLIAGVAPGQAVITVTGASAANADFSAATASATVTVTVSALPSGMTAVSVTPGTATLQQNRTQQLVFTATQPAGAAAARWTFGTTAPTVASVNDDGLITAVAPGTAVITATATSAANEDFAAATLTAQVAVTVTALPSGLSAISATPASVSLQQNRTQQLAVTASQPSGAPAATYAYESNNATVATVSDGGLITAVAPGTAVITVTGTSAANANFAAGSATDAVAVTVTALPAGMTAITVAPGSASLMQGRTLQLGASATQPAGAPAATYSYRSNNPAAAMVSDSGLITAVAPGTAVITVTGSSAASANFAAASFQGQATITVTALPAGLSAVAVTPSSLTLSVGSTGTLAAAPAGPGASAATTTYTSSNTAVATVNTTSGVVTAVAPGSATITASSAVTATADYAAATVTGTATVTVSPLAQVAISTITLANGNAVDAANVTGTIYVNTTITTNGNTVTSAQLFSCAVGATCPAAGQQPIAQQTFGGAGASSGNISFTVNTAAFRVNADTSAATVDFNNGQQTLVATLTTAGNSTSANSNIAVLNFNNNDGFAGFHRAPANSARRTPATADLWHGGPGANGRGRVVIVPVTYTPGRSVATVTVGMGAGYCNAGGNATPAANGTVVFTGARPWGITYGTTLGAAAGLNASNVICAGSTLAGATDVVPTLSAAIDNNNATYPTTFLTSTTTPVAVTTPAAIAGDWAAPTGTTFTLAAGANAVVGWVNGQYNFATNAGNVGGIADAGVGDSTLRLVEVRGCGSTTWTAAVTGNDINECGTDFGNTAYEARLTVADRLGNRITPVVSVQRFGVDKTQPQLRYAGSTDANATIYGSAALPADGSAADTLFSAQAIDERSGLLAGGSQFAQARTTAAGATCSTPAATAIGATPQTAPNCGWTVGAYGATTTDGWRQMTGGVLDLNGGVSVVGDGYYTYQPRVIDQAGNINTGEVRYILAQYSAPTAIAPTALPITTPAITASSALTFNGTVTDGIEASLSSLRLVYGANIFAFSATATANATFDNIIPGFGTATTGQTAVSGSTPFTSGTRIYTNLEEVDAAGNIVGAGGANSALSDFGFYANNFGNGPIGFANTAAVGIAVTPDATLWSAKAANASTFVLANSAAGFNAPAGGLKAQITSTLAQINSPVSRVDFYIANAVGVNEYVGTVTPDCDPLSATRNCYIADIGTVRTWTYRYTGTLANASTSTASRAYPGANTALRAVATLVTTGATGAPQGRGLFTNFPATVTVAAP